MMVESKRSKSETMIDREKQVFKKEFTGAVYNRDIYIYIFRDNHK